VVDGVQVAVLAKNNVKVRLFIEDDQSQIKGASTAYQKLKYIDKIADLGYFALRLVVEAIQSGNNPVAALKNGLTEDNIKFSFDENNVSHTVVQEVYSFQNGQPIKFISGSKEAGLSSSTSTPGN